jgi:ectoine hydroxylase-related dioxygenase (phytanoyl-CoA dioxygenase family)
MDATVTADVADEATADWRRPCPAPTEDVDQARADLAETGVGIVAGALDPTLLADVQAALYRAAEQDRRRARTTKYMADRPGDDTNQRVWNLPSRDPVFLDLVEHPVALSFVRQIVGWPALLSNISANITGPGGGEMGLHADQGYMPEPWSGAQAINIVWCVDDFTDANGATRAVPGSHALNRAPQGDDHLEPTVALEAPAGSMIAMEARLWHQTGNNRTASSTRAGIFAYYTPPIYLPQENWWLSLDPSVRQFGSETLRILFGYQVVGFGKVNGVSPEPWPNGIPGIPGSTAPTPGPQGATTP